MSPEKLVEHVTKAFESSDFGPLLEHLDENIVWKSASRQPCAFRFGGEYRGRSGVMHVTAEIFMTLSFARFRATEIVSDGEIVWGLFDTVVRPRHSATPIAHETAVQFRIRDGRILEVSTFFDTAGFAQALAAAQTPA